MGSYAPLSSDSSSWREPDDPASNLRVEVRELVEEETESKNWKGIIIAILVILTVFSFVTIAIILVTPDPVIVKTGAKLTLEEYLNGLYEPFVVKPVWDSDGEGFLYKTKQKELIYINCRTNESSLFLDNSTFRELNTEEYVVSADRNLILFPYHRQKIYDHSYLTRYKVYNTETRLYRELIGPRGHKFQYVTWTNGGRGLVVVQENNIFYLESVSDTKYNYIQLTFTGSEGTIYNGVPDWLYGEKILQSDHALWLSPDDNYLIFSEFNDTRVQTMETLFYGDPKHQYTEIRRQRYPKIGTLNPTFSLKIYNFKLNTTETITPPETFNNSEHYFTCVTWRNNISVAVIWLNRSQNTSVITICSALKAQCYEILILYNFSGTIKIGENEDTEKYNSVELPCYLDRLIQDVKNLITESEFGWVEPPKSLLFTPSSHEYFVTLPLREGVHGYFMQVAMVDARIDTKAHGGTGKTLFLTGGQMEVVEIVGFNAESQTVYFLGVSDTDNKQRHLYNATVNRNSDQFKVVHCLTCDIDSECLYVGVKFGIPAIFYILECLGPGVPSFHLYQTPDVFVQTLEENFQLHTFLSSKLLPVNDFVSIPHHSNPEIHMTGKMVLPPLLKKTEVIKYNTVLAMPTNVGDHLATYRFHLGWEHFMSSFHSIIFMTVDHRGSKGRGQTWSHAIFRNLGTIEVDDIITTLEFAKTLHYVNGSPAVMGKGYGGFLSLAALSSSLNDDIKCGIAITPVTDLNYMDTSYEKYTEASGNSGYNGDMHLSKDVTNLRSRNLLLLHGTLDDKVHFQHTAQYVKSLVSSGVYHQVQIYPDRGDMLNDETLRSHALVDIENFLLKYFELPSRIGPETGQPEQELDDYEE